MFFEKIWNISLLFIFFIVVYIVTRENKDQEKGKWDLIAIIGIVLAFQMLFDFLYFLMGRCGPVPLKEYFFLKNRDLGFCNLTVEFNYTIIAALVMAASWLSIVTLYKFLMSKRRAQ